MAKAGTNMAPERNANSKHCCTGDGTGRAGKTCGWGREALADLLRSFVLEASVVKCVQ